MRRIAMFVLTLAPCLSTGYDCSYGNTATCTIYQEVAGSYDYTVWTHWGVDTSDPSDATPTDPGNGWEYVASTYLYIEELTTEQPWVQTSVTWIWYDSDKTVHDTAGSEEITWHIARSPTGRPTESEHVWCTEGWSTLYSGDVTLRRDGSLACGPSTLVGEE